MLDAQLIDAFDAKRLMPPERPPEAAGASGGDWPELRPIESADDRPQPFPHRALGSLLGAAAEAIAEDVQAPDALAGGSVLAAAALAASPLADVRMPHGQKAPLNLYVITAAESGDRKSATDAVACHALDEHRRQQARDHASDMARWELENADRKKSEQSQPPAFKILTTGNATVEGIARLLKSQSSIGVFSPEGGEMLGGHSLREDKRVAGWSFYLKGWGAEALDSLRGGEGLVVLLGRRICLHVLVQPVLLRQLLGDPLAQGQGFLARCLIAQPETRAGSRLFRECDPLQNPSVVRFNDRITELLRKTPRTWHTGDGYELHPADMSLSAEARAAWIEFYNQVELAQAPGGELAEVRPFASKAAEHAARIAGVLAVVEDCHQVEQKHMLGGIELASFYMNEHIRLTGAGRTERRNQLLLSLAAWMQERGSLVNQADVLQRTPRHLRRLRADGIRDLLADLESRGYIRARGANLWEVRHVQG